MNFQALRTERLLLRELKQTDWPTIQFLRSDPDVNKLIIRPLTHTKEEALAFIQKIQSGINTQAHYYWVITQKENDTMIGSISLWNFSKDRKTGEVGYDLHPVHHKKGIMNEALQKVLAFGFNELRLDRIEAYTHRENTASKNLLERNHFELVLDRIDPENENNSIYSLRNHVTKQ